MTIGMGIAVAGMAIGLSLLVVRCITYRVRHGLCWARGYAEGYQDGSRRRNAGLDRWLNLSGPREAAAPQPRGDTTGRQSSRTGGRTAAFSRPGPNRDRRVAS